MLAEGICVHATSNRLRIRFPDRKGDHGFFAAISKQLSTWKLVRSVQANTTTGSLLILHETDLKQMAVYAAEQQMFSLAVPENPGITGERPVSKALVHGFNTVDGKVKGISDGALDLPEAVVLVLLGSGMYQLARGNWTAPAWYTCLWYGMNVFLKSHSPSPPPEGP